MRLRRIILDSLARTPLDAKVVSDEFAALTTIVVGKHAPKNRVAALGEAGEVLVAPTANSKLKIENSKLDLHWLLKKLGAENVTSLLVEGGGEVNASFLLGGLAQRVAFFYAPKILGGRDSRKAVAGDGAKTLSEVIQLREIEWQTARRGFAADGAGWVKRGSTEPRPAIKFIPCSQALSKKRASLRKSSPTKKSIEMTVRANVCGRGLKIGAAWR